MVKIPFVKIPSVRVGSIDPTSDIGTGGATSAPPTPITYLTQWMIVGNSEVHEQEIWSCGEYNATDGKYHILVKPQGGSVADIALDEPLRKVNDVADTIEFPSETEGKALVTRSLRSVDLGKVTWAARTNISQGLFSFILDDRKAERSIATMNAIYTIGNPSYYGSASAAAALEDLTFALYYSTVLQYYVYLRDNRYTTKEQIAEANVGNELIYELATPTTELVDAPQIEEADSYTCVTIPGSKALSWSSFETD